MRSFLQYRKFGKVVEEEYSRHREKLAANPSRSRTAQPRPIRTSSNSSSSSCHSDASLSKTHTKSTNGDTPDLEKGTRQESEAESPIDPDGMGYSLPAGVHVATRAQLQAAEDDMADLRTKTTSSAHPSSHPRTDDQHAQADCNNEPVDTAEPAEAIELAEDTPTQRPGRKTMNRMPTTRSARSSRSGAALGHSLTGVDVRSRTTKEGDKGDTVFVVGYQGPDDPLNPHNWPMSTRVLCTAVIAGVGFVVGVASSIDSSALPQAAKTFGVSQVTESLATGLYLIGFGAGALFAGPVSETLGRNPVYIVTLGLYMLFVMASGLAPNIGAQLTFRFLAGFFGSTPLVCAGGSISDMWNPMERVMAFPVFANAAFTGPVLGPVMGGFIAESKVLNNWRWTEWVTLIMSGLVLVMLVLFQPETYPNTLLRWRAKHLRRVTGDDRFRASVEVMSQTFLTRLKKALYRPFLLTLTEPIIGLIALYLTVIYIVLFTFLDGYTYIFQETYGVSQGITGLCFLGIMVGLFLASALVPLIYHWAKQELRRVEENGGHRLPPEFRLWFSMLGGSCAIPISLFWMGWTDYPWISIWSPIAASVLFGYGVLCVFISSYQYIIDSYEVYSASALASVTLIRYVAAGGMTVVGIPFYENMGVHWTLTILGGISALMAPLPYVFFKYGKWIRKKSKYAIDA